MNKLTKFNKIYRLIFAVLAWLAIWYSASTINETMGNFLSYFTIQSSILVALWFSLSIFNFNLRSSTVQSAIGLYVTVTMLIFFAFLMGRYPGISWVNSFGLHLILPLAYIFDWLVLNKSQKTASYKSSLSWLIFPVLYLAYSLIRGEITGWYPYYFLNASELGGTANLVFVISGLTVFFVAISQLVRLINNKIVK